ncbi:MAG: bifunctional diaminohydroxyphosphoribosylaminopyrimidine deaminase/5-amino-6-(5-phosphoribosylamino)uracil reductase RibD [Actinomycetota bacterium]
MTAASATGVTPQERELLDLARGLAERSRGHTSPNPLVGAVVVRDGRVVGQGHHERAGGPHAEVVALRDAGEAARGATVVCTLEPCSHHGRTPPCCDALVAAGVARVVIGSMDPLEERRGRGARILAEAGIEVAVADGADADACREMNAAFLTWAVTGRPLVTLKLATSLDGKVATATGESQWISGPASRALVHRWRAESDAVAVGIGTALADDPLLTARDVDGEVTPPRRVVFDSAARLPAASALVRGARDIPVTVVCGPAAPPAAVDALAAAGVEVLRGPADPVARIGWGLDRLGEAAVQSLLVEGGAGLAAAFLAAGAVDRVAWFVAPILIGGTGAPGAIGDPGAGTLAAAPRLAGTRWEQVGDDMLVTGRLRPLPGGGSAEEPPRTTTRRRVP